MPRALGSLCVPVGHHDPALFSGFRVDGTESIGPGATSFVNASVDWIGLHPSGNQGSTWQQFESSAFHRRDIRVLDALTVPFSADICLAACMLPRLCFQARLLAVAVPAVIRSLDLNRENVPDGVEMAVAVMDASFSEFQWHLNSLLRVAFSRLRPRAGGTSPRQLGLDSQNNLFPPVADNYELHFVGNAVLELSTSMGVFASITDASEGSLSNFRAGLVQNGVTSVFAARRGLDRLAFGDASGPKERAALYEACCGAIYRVFGLPTAAELIGNDVFMDDSSLSRHNDGAVLHESWIEWQR
jgi:hypothetical protein